MKYFLYSQPVKNFIQDLERIHDILKKAFEDEYGVPPGEDEYASWKKTLPLLAEFLNTNVLLNHEILLEFVPPSAGSRKRADVVLLGKGTDSRHVALIIENKRWPDSGIKPCRIEDFVVVGTEHVLHPSIQAEKYAMTTRTYHEAITSTDSCVKSCAFLPLTKDKTHPALNGKKFLKTLNKSPIFYHGQIDELQKFLSELMPHPPDNSFVSSFRKCLYQPSQSLLYVADKIFNEEEAWQLDENQQLAFNSIIAEVRNQDKKTKVAIVVKGGPGTGKSLIGMKLLGVFASELGEKVVYACGNSSFRDNLAGRLTFAVDQQELGQDIDFANLFTNFRAFHGKDHNSFDLAICDEAQRLCPDSSTAYEKVATKQEQALEVMQASRVSVFFLDENQRVRNCDIGTAERIKQTAAYTNAKYLEFDLVSQFRCCESENYIASLNGLFGLQGPETISPGRKSNFEFKIVDGPQELESKLKQHVSDGKLARMLAGYCWPWTKTKKKTEKLTNDVKIGAWEKPWNRNSTSTSKAYKGAHYLWANDPSCFDQIGCIHTSHGIEFDFIGVIMGGDLIYRRDKGWTCNKEKICDSGFKSGISKKPEVMTNLLVNIYRTLMTRGRNGCYLLCLDSETRQHIAENLNF